jgi:threonine dehydrogenase-like Zn-dependent dehydrogenase
MRAVLTRIGGLEVIEMEEPTPGPGQVLVRTLACGICGSDLHAAADLRRFVDLNEAVGGFKGLDPERGCVFGHEFCAEILDFGPGTERRFPAGTRVCSVPLVMGPNGPEGVGFSTRHPGGLAERMVLQEALLLPVPDGLSAEVAALTEPMAVGEHAINLARLTGNETCLVVGCGPIGLAVIAGLKARGAGPVVAADFSPGRRRLAELLGADEVVDPAVASPHSRWADLGVPTRTAERSAVEMMGGAARDALVFEAVGVPGVLRGIIRDAPPRTRIVVVGVSLEPDLIDPFFAIARELEIRFALGYRPNEFAATLDRLGGGLPVEALVTDVVGLDGAEGAFAALANPDRYGKVLVRPT